MNLPVGCVDFDTLHSEYTNVHKLWLLYRLKGVYQIESNNEIRFLTRSTICSRISWNTVARVLIHLINTRCTVQTRVACTFIDI